MLTNQVAYERMRAHLLQMPGPARVGAQCLYRSPNGPCLIGCLIPNDEYSRDLEGQGVSTAADDVPSIADLNRDFLVGAQAAHDSKRLQEYDSVEAWRHAVLVALDHAANLAGLRLPK